jgi:hypothetical protein
VIEFPETRRVGSLAELPTRPGRAGRIAWRAMRLLTVVVLVGCGADRFDPRSPAVEQARLQKVPAMTEAVDSALRGLTVHGTGQRDACEAGQDNVEVHDPYRMRCAAAYRAVAGMTADETAGAIEKAGNQLDRAGCAGTGSTDPGPVSQTLPTGSAAALWGGAFTCKGVAVRVLLGRSADSRFAAQAGAALPGPSGTTLLDQRLDAGRAFAEADRAGHRYVLIGDVGGDYYVEPRR